MQVPFYHLFTLDRNHAAFAGVCGGGGLRRGALPRHGHRARQYGLPLGARAV